MLCPMGPAMGPDRPFILDIPMKRSKSQCFGDDAVYKSVPIHFTSDAVAYNIVGRDDCCLESRALWGLSISRSRRLGRPSPIFPLAA